jgi:hypothetical protein
MTEETMPCKFCGVPTRMLGTKQCDGCWEIAHRVRHEDPKLLAKILNEEMTQESRDELVRELETSQ